MKNELKTVRSSPRGKLWTVIYIRGDESSIPVWNTSLLPANESALVDETSENE